MGQLGSMDLEMENEHAASAPAYIEPRGGQTYSLSEPRWRSDEGLPLMITPLPGIGRGDIHLGTRSLWRYAASFPVPIANPVTMGEGCTPLVERQWRGGRAYFKLEWFAPTGSFKDRGASVMISVLRQQGVTRLLEDSSGNGGAAVAAYAAAGGIKAKILVPAATQPGKIVQMKAYGAEVELIPGARQDTADEAQRQAKRIFYASHNWQAFFLQGTKTLAYELWEDLAFRAPHNILIPTGAGSNVLGCVGPQSRPANLSQGSPRRGDAPHTKIMARRLRVLRLLRPTRPCCQHHHAGEVRVFVQQPAARFGDEPFGADEKRYAAMIASAEKE